MSAGSVLSNAHLSRVSCDCERRDASAQKLHNNPEFLPGSAEQAANGQAITRIASVSPQATRKSNRMNSTATAALRLPILLDSIPRKLIVALAVTGFADWLFYDQKIGISVALFLLVLGSSVAADQPGACGLAAIAARRDRPSDGLASVAEEFNVLSATLAVLAACGCHIVTDQSADGWVARALCSRSGPAVDRPVPHFRGYRTIPKIVADAEILHRLGRSAAPELRLPAAVLIGQPVDRNLAQRHRPEGVAIPAQRRAAAVLERDAVRGLAVRLSEMDSQSRRPRHGRRG